MRILCVGSDHVLLDSRCAVLARHGYGARPALLPEAKELLMTAGFDLIIVSAMLSPEEKRRVLAVIPRGTKTLVLESLVTPSELLRMVAALFSWPAAADGRPPGAASRPEINVSRKKTETMLEANHCSRTPDQTPVICKL